MIASDQLEWRDLLGVRGASRALQAAAAAQAGDRATATAALSAVDPVTRTVVLADLQAAEAESWIAYRAGAADPASPVERAVAAAAGTGHDGWLAFAAHAAIRMGCEGRVLPTLRAADPQPTASVFRSIVAHGDALSSRDGAALLRASAALEAAGMNAGAHDAARQALDVARAADSTDLARRARSAMGRVASGLAPARADAGDVLTAREWSVATAAAARERNREIAARLGLSLRTVENHLASAYRKLGVSGRDELRAALEDTAS